MSPQLINALVKAAEREGGIHMLEMCCNKRKWRRCVKMGHLWYGNRVTHSTHVVKLEK